MLHEHPWKGVHWSQLFEDLGSRGWFSAWCFAKDWQFQTVVKNLSQLLGTGNVKFSASMEINFFFNLGKAFGELV